MTTTPISIKGYTSDVTTETIYLTLYDPKVTRTMNKTDTVYVAYPVNDVTGGGFGFDLGFCEETFTIDITLVDSDASTIYKKLWYTMKVNTESKELVYDGQTFSVLCRRISTTQTAGQGGKRTITMDLIVVTE